MIIFIDFVKYTCEFYFIPYNSYSTKLTHEENELWFGCKIFLLGVFYKGWLNSLSFDAFQSQAGKKQRLQINCQCLHTKYFILISSI